MKNVLFLCVITLLLGSCENDHDGRSSLHSTVAGDYMLTSLISNVPVDLNGDGIFHLELLLEAFCFSSMDVSFLINGDFVSTVAEPTFDSNNNLSCPLSSQSGSYLLDENNVLTVTANEDGGTITDSKQVIFTTNTFEFTVTGAEMDQYIRGRNSTPAAGITSLMAVYTKN
ncbi:hypothetical protein [uncultured Nonlabens sp.]|uniref:hypothetical protein n=1 Tax=uncultured Nonlabens sp. TaxID=859306 RepID=UPI0026263CC7|nr:hypothetical protein [uncultured Nonlabens sp.]